MTKRPLRSSREGHTFAACASVDMARLQARESSQLSSASIIDSTVELETILIHVYKSSVVCNDSYNSWSGRQGFAWARIRRRSFLWRSNGGPAKKSTMSHNAAKVGMTHKRESYPWVGRTRVWTIKLQAFTRYGNRINIIPVSYTHLTLPTKRIV